nr:MAG TPA: hypothetical protein [Caudoviricetes sp.]
MIYLIWNSCIQRTISPYWFPFRASRINPGSTACKRLFWGVVIDCWRNRLPLFVS